MAPYQCAACGGGFTGLESFDRHLPPIVDGPKQDRCRDPASVGLEPNGRGHWQRARNRVSAPQWVESVGEQPQEHISEAA